MFVFDHNILKVGGHLEQGVGQIACADVQVQAAAVGDSQALFETGHQLVTKCF